MPDARASRTACARSAAPLIHTDGARLVCEGSPVPNLLHEFKSQRVDVIRCGACVEHFLLKETRRVGTVGGMPDIMEAVARADKVVSV